MNKKQNYFVYLALLGTAFMAASCAKHESGSSQAFSTKDIGTPNANASGTGGVIIANRGGLTRSAVFDPGEYGVDFWTTEINGSDIYRSQNTVTTSFALAVIEARHPDQIFVAGLDEQTGETVVEKWTNHPPAGALGGSMFTATTGVGVPSPLHWPTVAPVGGTFIPPANRAAALPPTKVSVYRGLGFGGISSLSVDPEGRFILLQDASTGSVYQLVPGSTPTLIADAQSNPGIATARLGPPSQIGTSDRVYVMLDSENFKFGILHDADNDGNFDPVQILDYDQLMQTFPLEPYGDYKPMK